jgi:hypothetical protein
MVGAHRFGLRENVKVELSNISGEWDAYSVQASGATGRRTAAAPEGARDMSTFGQISLQAKLTMGTVRSCIQSRVG